MKANKGSDERDFILVVKMSDDYTTESNNLGKRTFRRGECYQVCEVMCEEVVQSGVGVLVDPYKIRTRSIPEREQVEVIPSITRWLSSNGLDTHYLVVGERITLPSNLAAYVTLNGYGVVA